MSALGDAQLHLAKAREFLEAAEASLVHHRNNAAASDAVLAGINAKDAICLALTGRTGKGESHHEAVPELKRAGRAGATLAPTLSRLLKVKTKAQYTPASVTSTDARRSVEWAQRLIAGAQDVAAGR